MLVQSVEDRDSMHMHRYLPLNTSQCFVCFAYLPSDFIHLVKLNYLYVLLLAARHTESECDAGKSHTLNRIFLHILQRKPNSGAVSQSRSRVNYSCSGRQPSSFIDWSCEDTQSSNSNQTHARDPFTNTRGMHSVV